MYGFCLKSTKVLHWHNPDQCQSIDFQWRYTGIVIVSTEVVRLVSSSPRHQANTEKSGSGEPLNLCYSPNTLLFLSEIHGMVIIANDAVPIRVSNECVCVPCCGGRRFHNCLLPLNICNLNCSSNSSSVSLYTIWSNIKSNPVT